jgi:hypothetical protein
MKRVKKFSKALTAMVVAAGLATILVGNAKAHCDTVGGPVIPEARAALEKGEVTPVLKWVKAENEAEIRRLFAQAVAVRGKGGDAKALADQHFLETLIRLHRAGEGAPYTGIKDEPVEPIAAMADQTLASGSAEELIGMINTHLAGAIREKFQRVVATAKEKDKSIDAGREYVEAYVTYLHYVEGVHAAIAAAGDHHGGGGEAGPAEAEHQKHHE